jgi:hypothetical protein
MLAGVVGTAAGQVLSREGLGGMPPVVVGLLASACGLAFALLAWPARPAMDAMADKAVE